MLITLTPEHRLPLACGSTVAELEAVAEDMAGPSEQNGGSSAATSDDEDEAAAAEGMKAVQRRVERSAVGSAALISDLPRYAPLAAAPTWNVPPSNTMNPGFATC